LAGHTWDLNIQSQHDQSTKSANIHQNAGNNYNMESDFLLFDEMMNLDIPTATTFVSTHTQTDKNVEMLDDKSERQSVSEFILCCVKIKSDDDCGSEMNIILISLTVIIEKQTLKKLSFLC
jgi:hypothetical protein